MFTVVASYALSKVTVPPRVDTSIEPTYELPASSVEGKSKKTTSPVFLNIHSKVGTTYRYGSRGRFYFLHFV